ncbi:restriction endonuclease subunit S [Lactobacillus delbrueckii]|uniref:restriction endonuclease subunit S n=1 Tax=Lactobacillus delbrueckii TaxID=1584 RepID=UPI000A4350C1|nr:restriction endonuclease subunit S [Lactobacillus delbrueckii]
MASFINGRAYKQDELLDKGKYRVLRVGNLYTNDSWYYSNMELDDKYYINKGDLIYTWSATFGPHIWDGERVIYHYHIWKVELSDCLDKKFATQLLEIDKAKLLSNTNGSTMVHITKNGMENKQVILPSITEQSCIGKLLRSLDQIITLHEEKKRQLERLKSALMQKMFADKSGYPAVRFNGFCDEWKKQKLGDIVETITDYVAAGSFASLRENVIYRSKPCYAQLIRTADLKSNFSKIAPVYVDKQAFDFLYRVSLDKESVILPNIGNCGEVYYVDPHELPYMRNVLGPNAILIRSSSLNNHFLSILFQSHNFQKSLKLIISPNGQTKFNKTELKRIKMVLPMDVNEQNSLSAFFKMINTAISLQEHKSNILKELKSSLLQNMFI